MRVYQNAAQLNLYNNGSHLTEYIWLHIVVEGTEVKWDHPSGHICRETFTKLKLRRMRILSWGVKNEV